MTFDELLEKAATEPIRVEVREVSVASADLLKEIEGRPGMLLSDIVADPRRHIERRTFRSGHVFGRPLLSEALDKWMAARPAHPLPPDLQALLLRVNGIHLWADLDSGRAYQGLAPLDEWDLARTTMWGPDADRDLLGDEYLALSYHTDGSGYVVLKATTGEYFFMDSCGADETCRVGGDVGALLDWLWDDRIAG